jgi:hypothetical protein
MDGLGVGDGVGRDEPGVLTEPLEGDPDAPAGVSEMLFEAAPAPAEFTALIRTGYAVPFVRPGITIGEVVAGGLGVTQVDPLIEY